MAADPFRGAFEVFRSSFENDQDLDYDLHPDDWTRRIGRDFPHYVTTEIDRAQGSHGRQSLKVLANGGPAILYSPVWRVDPLHAYVFQGAIKTLGLKHDAAVVSVSFLNHKRLVRICGTEVKRAAHAVSGIRPAYCVRGSSKAECTGSMKRAIRAGLPSSQARLLAPSPIVPKISRRIPGKNTHATRICGGCLVFLHAKACELRLGVSTEFDARFPMFVTGGSLSVR